MKFTRLRLSGFKSFVEPTELLIEPGLTGIVGPNGCGKSNLLEALRWVMGESSYKSMRASGMDDVIFSGTTERPSRNMAEVVVTLASEDEKLLPQFAGSDQLEISRRIEREAGSAYRINGKDVRARDVQLLFADASTGARSPALVRQGQIAEIINAKPQARRLILEEAAGITGLHTRRHEAELKLKAAEQNLARLEDVTSQLETQLGSLKRQARQASKYKQISAEIRKLEAAGLYAAWMDAKQHAEADATALETSTRELAEQTRLASEALRLRDEQGDRLPALREAEAVRSASLQRMNIERNALDEEERRVEQRRQELEGRLSQAESDLARESEMLADNEEVLQRLAQEGRELEAARANDVDLRTETAAALQAVAAKLAAAQEAADAAGQRLSELTAQRNAYLREADEARRQAERLAREQVETAERRQSLLSALDAEGDGPALAAAVQQAISVVASNEASATDAERALREARQRETETRQAYDEARRKAERLQTEVRTLASLLKAGGDDMWPALVDQLRVTPGYEPALGAALGDDLDASSDEGAPVHWRGLPPLEFSAPLPDGAQPLSSFVEAPAALARRLSHVGVVSRAIGPALQSQLAAGQRLVSPEGDLWRWDGYTSAADAPSAAARRLAERNRLTVIEGDMAEAFRLSDAARAALDDAQSKVEEGSRHERDRRETWRAASAALEVARQAQARHERLTAERLAQTSALDEALRRIAASLDERHAAVTRIDTELSNLPPVEGLAEETATLRDAVNAERATYAEARARHDGVEREANARDARFAAIARESEQWAERIGKARQQIDLLTQRCEETRSSLVELAGMPQQLADKRQKLMSLLQLAEAEKRQAADALAEGENALRSADQHLRNAQEQVATARQEHARTEARLEASHARRAEAEHRISESLHCEPHTIPETMGFDGALLESVEAVERRLQGLRDDRERLGAVNLRADEEAQQVAQQLAGLVKERDDLVQAIHKLRGGISSLNREGRQRLLDSFETVNEKFAELFTTLFGGGKAELQLVESHDPLEAGLEILAHPPGKKPTVLSLLSGGEQSLTALALIFAVFLTNPSPICVLDEVDAPLDDHNVERFCNLLDAMLQRTATRFLIITHHELTMARMHRLFGVTMAERGVSQLVSVNLDQASELAEAS
jgi:chromosome segregation protein